MALPRHQLTFCRGVSALTDALFRLSCTPFAPSRLVSVNCARSKLPWLRSAPVKSHSIKVPRFRLTLRSVA